MNNIMILLWPNEQYYHFYYDLIIYSYHGSRPPLVGHYGGQGMVRTDMSVPGLWPFLLRVLSLIRDREINLLTIIF